MPDTKRCDSLAVHPPHTWSKDDEFGKRRSPFFHCLGVPEDAGMSTQQLALVGYHNLTELKFSLVTREGVPTEFTFADLLPGDSKATITVVEGDDRWAVVDIRILARKPYTAREIDE